MQDEDPYPQYADDADIPEGESEVAFRVKAATDIKALGNDLYKKVLKLPRPRPMYATLIRVMAHEWVLLNWSDVICQ